MYHHDNLMPYLKKALKSFILLIYSCADIILFLFNHDDLLPTCKDITKKMQFNPIIKGSTQNTKTHAVVDGNAPKISCLCTYKTLL